MHAWLNKVEGQVEVQGATAVFTPVASHGNDAAVVRFDLTQVEQLLRSRKDDTTLKFIVDTRTYIARFDSGAEREKFVDILVRSKSDAADSSAKSRDAGTNITSSTEKWVTSSICSAAVDHGILDDEELRALLDSEEQRGVVHVFDALEALVDRDTLRLLPVTEQLENDILHQIPILAAIYANRVVDLETRQSFWEAVVRKYFCFSRTFLEDDMRQMESEAGTPLASSGAAEKAHDTRMSATPPDNELRAINCASLEALPSNVQRSAPPAAQRVRGETLLLPTEATEKGSAVYEDDDERHLMDLVQGHTHRPQRLHVCLFHTSKQGHARVEQGTADADKGDQQDRSTNSMASAEGTAAPSRLLYYVGYLPVSERATSSTSDAAVPSHTGHNDEVDFHDAPAKDSARHVQYNRNHCANNSAHAYEFRGVYVHRNPPRESTSRQVLELLRKFWRSTSADTRRGMRNKLHEYARDSQTSLSFAMRHCLRRACDLVDDMEK